MPLNLFLKQLCPISECQNRGGETVATQPNRRFWEMGTMVFASSSNQAYLSKVFFYSLHRKYTILILVSQYIRKKLWANTSIYSEHKYF
jgi:hypothetical protein